MLCSKPALNLSLPRGSLFSSRFSCAEQGRVHQYG
jgi:hypothetical protein